MSESFVNNRTIFSVIFFFYFCGCAEEGVCIGGGF